MYQRSIGGTSEDKAKTIINTSDGGYAFLGSTRSHSAGNLDLYLVKLDTDGDTLWTRTYGGPAADEGAILAQTPDDGYMLFGRTESFGAQFSDLWLVRTDASGAELWTKRYDSPAFQEARALCPMADGGYLLGGTTFLTGGQADICVVRTDADGAVLWSWTYGGTAQDQCRGLVATADGGFMLTGLTESFEAEGMDTFVMRCTDTGDVTWGRTYGDWGTDGPFSMCATPNGYMVAGATSSSGFGQEDAFLLKIYTAGGIVWVKTYGTQYTEAGTQVRSTADGGYLVLGRGYWVGTDGAIFAMKTTSTGDTLWTRRYGGTDLELEGTMVDAPDGGYLICGSEESFAGGTFSDAYLIKTDAQGRSWCYDDTTSMVMQTATWTSATVSPLSVPMAITVVEATSEVSSGSVVHPWCGTALGIAPPPAGVALEVYPVPCSTTFQVIGTRSRGLLSIVDITGKVLSMHSTSDGSTTIDAQGLKPGSYLLRYAGADGPLVLRLLKE